jgi:hypothetical protein
LEEISKELHILPIFPKTSFRASKWPRKLKTAKNSKLPKLPENCFEPVGKGGWPPISTWIKNKEEEREGFVAKCTHRTICFNLLYQETHFCGCIPRERVNRVNPFFLYG